MFVIVSILINTNSASISDNVYDSQKGNMLILFVATITSYNFLLPIYEIFYLKAYTMIIHWQLGWIKIFHDAASRQCVPFYISQDENPVPSHE